MPELMPFADCDILQFTREPRGEVKTRLAPVLNSSQRLELHRCMTRHAARRISAARLAPLTLAVEGDPEHAFLADLAAETQATRVQQSGSDLGERMLKAVQASAGTGRPSLLVGSDCPFIDMDYLRSALEHLSRKKAVIGPAGDGGYVLLGLREPEPALFRDIDWGSERVLLQTEARLRELGWTWSRLPERSDIDRPEDLRLLAATDLPAELRRFAAFAPTTASLI